jgi:hypothetical protein
MFALPAILTLENTVVLPPSLIIHYDASDSSTIVFSSGNNVSQWKDKSGNNRHLNTTGVSPTWSASSDLKNGLPVMTFSALSTGMVGSHYISSPFSIVLVAREANTQLYPRVLQSASIGNCHMTIAENTQVYLSTVIRNGSIGVPSNGWYCVTFGAGSTKSELWYNNSNYYTGSSTNNTSWGGLAISAAGYYPQSNRTFNGAIAEILVFSGRLTTAERVLVQDYIRAKWNV